MITRKQASLLRDTWRVIQNRLSTLDWTDYGAKLLDLSLEESKAHDRFRGSRPRAMSINQEARFFAISRLVEYHGQCITPDPSEFFFLQKSCFAAYAIMKNSRFAEIRIKILADCLEDMREIASWDYVELMKDEPSPVVAACA